MANWLTYRIKVGDDVLVLADEAAQELIKNETERSKKADAQTASFLESTTTNGIIGNSKSDPFGQTAIGGMKVVIDKGDLIINGNIKNHARLTRTYNVTQENRTEVFLYRFDSVTNEIAGLWRDCIIQGDIILSREDKTELPLRSSGYYDILICKITIPAGATEITQDMIGDFRQNEYYCGYAKNLLVDIDETLTKSDAAADAAAVGTAISNLRKETRTRDIITEKRITNLEAGLPAERWSVDDSVAYIKKVPENALPFASVDMVGGMTYKDGETLRSAPVTEVESVGANLCDLLRIPDTLNGLTFTKNTDGTVTINGTANAYTTVYFDKIEIKTGEKLYHLGGGNGTTFTFNGHIGDAFIKNIGTADNTVVQTIECDGTYDSFYPIISIEPGQSFSNATVRFIVSKTPFVYFLPYRRNTLPIPAEVQALGGYGWGVNDKIYNYIDWERKQFVKRVGYTNFGDINLRISDATTYYAAVWDIGMKQLNPVATSNIAFTTNYSYFSAYNGEIIGAMSEGTLYIKNHNFPNMTDAERQEYLKSIELYYELATPAITDISDLLPDDNLIGVEGGGTVTMVNEYGYDVPSEITYQLKGAEA